jgi:hypothetical protein
LEIHPQALPSRRPAGHRPQAGDPIYIRARSARSSIPKLYPFWVPATLLEVLPNHVVRVRAECRGCKTPKAKIISADDIKSRVILPASQAPPRNAESASQPLENPNHKLPPQASERITHAQPTEAEPRRSSRRRHPPARLAPIALPEMALPVLQQLLAWVAANGQVLTPLLIWPAGEHPTAHQSPARPPLPPPPRGPLLPVAQEADAEAPLEHNDTPSDASSDSDADEDFFTPPARARRAAEHTPSPRIPHLPPEAYGSPFVATPDGARACGRRAPASDSTIPTRRQPDRAAKTARRVRFSPSEAALLPQSSRVGVPCAAPPPPTQPTDTPVAAARSLAIRSAGFSADFAPPRLWRTDRQRRGERSDQSHSDKQ